MTKERTLMDAQTAQSLLNFSEGAGPGLRGLEAKALFEQLDQQYDDLQLALQWFIEQGRANEALRLASSLVPFWMATKRLDEGGAWFHRALALHGGDEAYRGRALFPAGVLGVWEGGGGASAA